MGDIEHWTLMPDGTEIGNSPFPRGHVLVKLADRNREVYELGVQLRGAVKEARQLRAQIKTLEGRVRRRDELLRRCHERARTTRGQ